MKVSSLLKRSYEEKVSFINPELIYQKTKFRDQSKDPIFDLHPRNSSILETYNNQYFFGDDRVPDTEALIGKLKWQLRHSNNRRYSLELIKRNDVYDFIEFFFKSIDSSGCYFIITNSNRKLLGKLSNAYVIKKEKIWIKLLCNLILRHINFYKIYVKNLDISSCSHRGSI